MELLHLHNKNFTPYLSSNDISTQVRRIGLEISRDYKDLKPLFLPILNGSFMFASDLMKEIKN